VDNSGKLGAALIYSSFFADLSKIKKFFKEIFAKTVDKKMLQACAEKRRIVAFLS